jgi:hypothetical protein
MMIGLLELTGTWFQSLIQPNLAVYSFVLLSSTMATTSKQYKAIGEDLWKSRTDKIVRFGLCVASPGQSGPN